MSKTAQRISSVAIVEDDAAVLQTLTRIVARAPGIESVTGFPDGEAALLGVPEFEVLERWQGVYATSDAQDVLAAEPLPGVHAVTLTTGVGMTVGLALGARTVAAL